MRLEQKHNITLIMKTFIEKNKTTEVTIKQTKGYFDVERDMFERRNNNQKITKPNVANRMKPIKRVSRMRSRKYDGKKQEMSTCEIFNIIKTKGQ